jgi:hypothetical protein
MEHIGELLSGFAPATKLLENQWQAVKSTIETTATQILRGLMKPAYDDIIQSTKDLNDWLVQNKETIIDWGIKFQLALIPIQAEIMRLAMLLDKLGGTMTSAQMLLYGPGRALGVDSSTKRFEAAADANIEYEKRYMDTDKALEVLALKQIKLEQSLTTAYKERQKAQETAVSPPKGGRTTATEGVDKKTLAAMKAAAKERERLLDEKYKHERDIAEAIAKAEEDMAKDADAGTKTTLAGIKKLQDDRIAFYDTIEGYENKAYELKFARIEEERQAYIALYDDVGAANAKASQDQLKALTEKIDAEQKGTRSTISGLNSMLSAAMECYSEESNEYKRLQDFKKVALAAELAMEVSKNAQIIAGYFAQSAGAVAAATVQNAANASTAVTGAVASVAAQGTVPIAGFAMVPAMIAIMAGVLGIAGIAFGGGGSSSAASTSNPAMGNSTVLGAAYGTGSESIQNSYELLQDTYDLEDVKLTKIYNELKNLNSNITGLVSSMLRTGTLDIGDLSNTIGNASWMNTAGTVSSQIIGLASADPFTLITHTILEKLTGGTLGKNIANFIGKIFGGSSETTLQESGVLLGSSSLQNILKNGISSQQYASYKKVTDGGWFHSDKTEYWTQYAALDSEVTNLFNKVYQNLGETLMELSEGLGTNINDVLNYSFAELKLNLQGKTGDEISKALSEAFSAVGDTAVEALFGDIISMYQEVNEGMLETAVRLITDKESILNILEYTNQSFEGTTSELIKFSESLITVAGSLETLTDAFNTYYDAFFSDAEKQADLKSSLSGALEQYGYTLPGERSGYRSIVESQNLASEAGQTAYAALMLLADSADAYYKYLEDAEAAEKAKKESARSAINESDYATRVEYQRALSGFAYGGISAGPESGYEATLHGTELIVSPKKGYSATVINGDSAELVAELKATRKSIEQGNFFHKANSDKIVKLLDRWEAIGPHAVRT